MNNEKVHVPTNSKVVGQLKKLGFSIKQVQTLDENFVIVEQANAPTLEDYTPKRYYVKVSHAGQGEVNKSEVAKPGDVELNSYLKQ